MTTRFISYFYFTSISGPFFFYTLYRPNVTCDSSQYCLALELQEEPLSLAQTLNSSRILLTPDMARPTNPGSADVAARISVCPQGTKTQSIIAPLKAHSFLVSAPAEASVEAIIDALEDAVSSCEVLFLQHHGGMRFMITLSCQAAVAAKHLARIGISLCRKDVSEKQVSPQQHHVSIFRLPPLVQDEALL